MPFAGGAVLDPFAGSGSTLVAAVKEGFRAVGIELEGEYAKLAAARVSRALKGGEGKLIADRQSGDGDEPGTEG